MAGRPFDAWREYGSLTRDSLIGQRHFDVKPLDIINRRVSEGICRNVFPRLLFWLRKDAKVALPN